MPGTTLQEHSGSDKAWVWTAVDFAEEKQSVELFCVRFGSVESERRAQELPWLATWLADQLQHIPRAPLSIRAASCSCCLGLVCTGSAHTWSKAGACWGWQARLAGAGSHGGAGLVVQGPRSSR
jgi:hypothetical protein